MFKSGIQGFIQKSRTFMNKNFGTESQGILASMIYDDDVEVLTTFDMNRIASLTFGDEVCGELFDLIEYTLRHTIEFTVLTLHKTIVLLHHLAIYASQKAANAVWILKPHITPLKSYNTVLLALDNPKSMLGRIQRIKGGNVDRGEPVRKSSTKLMDLLNDVKLFKQLRSKSEDPNSLVPVGDKEEVGFVSDEVRKAMLQEKIRQQHKVDIKSNLKGPKGAGFGSGYNAHDGRNVVGAAHGLEEMLRMAEKNNIPKYKDSGVVSEEEKREQEHLSQLKYQMQMSQVNNAGLGGATSQNNVTVVDLLDFNEPATNQTTEKALDSPEEIPKTPSLPYPYSKEEAFLNDSDDDSNDDEQVDNIAGDYFGTGGVLPTSTPTKNDDSSNMNQRRTATASTNHDDLLNLSSASVVSTPSVTNNSSNNNGIDLLQMSMGNMNMNATVGISDSLNTNNGANSFSMIMGGQTSNSASAISTLDLLSPMDNGGGGESRENGHVLGGLSSSTSGNNIANADHDDVKPSIPSPMMEIPSVPSVPSLPSNPPPPPPSSSPPPMGGSTESTMQTPTSDMMMNNNMNGSMPNQFGGSNMMNGVNQQQQPPDMMKMMMNQQQMMQQMNNPNNNPEQQQAQMMQQMMMMNQQQPASNNSYAQQQQLMQQQQMMMMMMGQPQQQLPQGHMNNDTGNANGGNANDSYPSNMNPFSG